jgi:uncharacterized membrane protein HdeD (DUF308 family)
MSAPEITLRLEGSLAAHLAKYWWVLLLRGVFALLFGVLAWLWPGLTLETLVLFFGAFALVSGVFQVFAAFAGRRQHEQWWILLLEGLLGIAVGFLTWRAPGITALALVLYIAAWALVTGVLEIVEAIRLRKEIEGELWLGLSGLLSVGFGILLMIAPGAGALALLWIIAAYAVVFGAFLILLAFRVRRAAAA